MIVGEAWSFLDFAILRSAGLAANRLPAVTEARPETGEGKMAAELRALRREAHRPDLRDALWLASPELLCQADKSAETGRQAERVDRKLYAYLQRYCAKNDTISAFGPVSYLWIGENIEADRSALRLGRAKREASLSHWACLKLARALVADSKAAVLAPLAVPPWIGDAQRRTLSACQADLLDELEEHPRSLDDLAAARGAGPDRLTAALALIALGCLRPSLDPHPISFDGLGDIAARADAIAKSCRSLRLRSRLGRIRTELRTLGRARALPARMAAVGRIGRMLEEIAPHEDWRPPAGDPDRALFFEDALAPAAGPFLAAGSWRRITSALDLPLRLMGARAAAKRMDWRDWCAQRLRGQGLSGTVPLEQVIASLGASGPDALPASLPRVEAFDRAMTGLLGEVPSTDAGIQLNAGALEAFLEEWPQPTVAFASPDLLFEAPPQHEGRIILGEVHGGATVWSFLLKFMSGAARDAIGATLRSWLSSLEVTPCELMIARRRGRSFLLDLPVAAIEAAHPAGPNAAGRMSFRDVRVDLADFAVTDVVGRPLEILRSGWSGPLADVLATEVEHFPLRTGGREGRAVFTPRISLGDLVLQRARWEVEVDRLKVPLATAPRADRRRAAAGARQRLGLPRQAYVICAPGEKPAYVDLESEICLDWLLHALPARGRIVFTEPVPRLEDAWLVTMRGRVSAEIRTTAFWGPSRSPIRETRVRMI